MQLTDAQIAGHVVHAGFTGHDRETAVAIVLAESRGRTDARGDVGLATVTWGPSIGLFQIRSLNAQKGTGGVRDEKANLDPGTNATHAHRIFLDAGGFTPWSTFLHGSHLPFLARAKASLEAAPAAVAHRITIEPGDTLSRIAHQHGTTLAHLRTLNPALFDARHHHGDLVFPGELVTL